MRLPPDLRFLILVKDKFRISDEAFKELSQLLKDTPTFYAFSKKIKELDAEVNVVETPGKAGVQVSFKESSSKKIRKLAEFICDTPIINTIQKNTYTLTTKSGKNVNS